MRRGTFVTGASGFVGSRLCRQLKEAGQACVAGVRQKHVGTSCQSLEIVEIGPLESRPKLTSIFSNIDCVIHLAAMPDCGLNASAAEIKALNAINVEGAAHVAEQAALGGVRRMLFVSSIKVHGESTTIPFTGLSALNPSDPYAHSKLAGEKAVRAITAKYGTELVVIRPPLIYGPNPRGNIRKLLELVNSRLPLPFGCINNKRSMVALDNLCDLLLTCIDHPNAVGDALLVSDDEDLSTKEVVQLMNSFLGKNKTLVPIPPVLLRLIGAATGRSDQIKRLTTSLQVDIKATRERLNWSPPRTASSELELMCSNWINSNRRY